MERIKKEYQMKYKFLKAAFASLILSIGGFANAGLIATTYNSGGGLNTSDDFTLGWRFMVHSDFTIDGLAMFDDSTHGQPAGVQDSGDRVGLWTENGTLLADVTFNANTIYDTADGGNFLVQSIAGVDLTAGMQYWIGRFIPDNGLDMYSNSGSWTTDSRFTANQRGHNGFNLNNGFSIPNTFALSALNTNIWTYMSASFTIANSVQVPEPSTLAIFALGVIGLALRRFKKQA